jgi:hypothetical protein
MRWPRFSLDSFYLSSFPYTHSHFGLKVSFAKQFFFSHLSISTKCLLFSNHFHSLESVLKCVRVFYIIFMFVSLYSTPSVLFFYVSCPLHFCKLQISWPFYIFVLHVYTCKVNIDIFSIHENVLFLTGTKVQFWTEKKII